jgi:HTH-type transcriptional regulator, sugar sensing transcriptional regulator
VYLAALEIGRATADQLAKHAKIVRPTTYVQIKSLMEKGLMSTYEEGKKTYFAPESPEALRRVLDQQKEQMRTREDELSRLIPGLTQMFASAGERPVVRFFPGKEGIEQLRVLSLKTKTKRHSFIYSYESMASLFSSEERKAYTERRIAEGIEVRSIISTKESEMKNNYPEITKLLPVPADILPIKTDLVIWDGKLNIVFYGSKPFGVLLESGDVAQSFQATFDLLWKLLSEKYKVI